MQAPPPSTDWHSQRLQQNWRNKSLHEAGWQDQKDTENQTTFQLRQTECFAQISAEYASSGGNSSCQRQNTDAQPETII
jgi:heme-degrading monooxygenase HmoA